MYTHVGIHSEAKGQAGSIVRKKKRVLRVYSISVG